MISFCRIGAIVFRHLMTLKRLSWIIEVSYWPVLHIIIFGLLGKATAMMTGVPLQIEYINTLIINAVLWYLVLRGAITIGFIFLNEIFDANLISLFATPLRKLEWIIAAIIVGSMAALFTLFFGAFSAYLIFQCNILTIGWSLIAIISLLLISGWSLGLFLVGILLFMGKRGVELAFAICWVLLPFSCVYYPLEVFPLLLQKIVWLIPMTHIFTATRTILNGGYAWNSIAISFGLNIVYLILAVSFFAFMFNRSKKSGLARLELGW